MKLIIISVLTVLATAMVLTSIHLYGLSQKHTAFETGFFTSENPQWIVDWAQADRAPETVALWVDVYLDEDTLRVRPVSFKPFNDKKDHNSADPDLRSITETRYPKRKFVLNVMSNVDTIHIKLREFLIPQSPLDTKNIQSASDAVLVKTPEASRWLIQSDYNLILESTKKLVPDVLYGSTPADRMRLLSFQSLWIETFVPLKGDAYISPLYYDQPNARSSSRGRLLVNDGLHQEIKRRQKKMLLGPLKSAEEVTLAQSLGADGLIVDQADLVNRK